MFYYIWYVKKSISTTLFFILVSGFCFSQNNKIDSLLNALSVAKEDSAKTVILQNLSYRFETLDRIKSFDYAKQALASAEKNNQQKKLGECLNYLGDLYWFSGDYSTCSEYYFKALKIYEDLKDEAGIAICYRNIGWIYQGQKNYELTISYYNKAMEINKRLGKKRNLLANYDDLGIVYKMKKDYEKALEYCNLTIELGKEISANKGLATGYGNLGSIYHEIGNYKEAIKNFELSNEIHIKNKDDYNLAEGYNGIAECFLNTKEYDKSIATASKALEISQKNNFRTVRTASYAIIAKAYSGKKNFETAYDYLDKFTQLQDSTYNEKNARQINEMSAKYESEKKELLISSLENEKALADEKLEQEKRFKIYLIAFCLMIAVFSIFLYRNILQKKKANSALSEAYKQIEVKNKDITDSINYSKRIQEAMLPSSKLKYKLFKDIFILYKPKDIVSGDFYWYTEKNGKRFIAACDCTGHGVPGALMSMIGNNILNQIVSEKGITEPNEILSQLNYEIKKSLKQNQKSETKDGMDIALVCLKPNNEIEFAGAQRPLWIIRSNGTFEDIKANKFSIGGMHTENEEDKLFDKHTIQLQENDSIYLFTDGFADQFGGKEGKKFMSKRLKEILIANYSLPMTNQESLLEKSLNDWKGNIEQVDDVLVIGVKI
jgi:serine phosphatase RsbU (regulator of sigma subunit)